MATRGGQTESLWSRWGEMVYRGARRGDIATQGQTAAEDLHMDMDDRWQRTVWDGSSGYSRDDAAGKWRVEFTLHKKIVWKNDQTDDADMSDEVCLPTSSFVRTWFGSNTREFEGKLH